MLFTCFVSEPVHNLVHREIMEPAGVSFTSHRAADETDSEFLASSDNWFRPTMTKTGPDGALYVADMYRLIIEHPEWIPEDFQKSVDLRAGAKMGRIYRVYPTNASLRPIPRLDQLNTKDLAAAMESPNGWQRDTVQRLLVSAGDKTAAPGLENLLLHSPNPKTRLQALGTLDGLGALNARLLIAGLKDSHPSVRENAVRLSESLFNSRDQKNAGLEKAVLALADDAEVRVRYQVAFTLGEVRGGDAGAALTRIALHDIKDDRVQTAVKTSAPRHLSGMIASLVANLEQPGQSGATKDHPPDPRKWMLLSDLINLSVALNDEPAIASGLPALCESRGTRHYPWQFAGMAGLLDALDRRKITLSEFQKASHGELKHSFEKVDSVFTDARKSAGDPSTNEDERVAAIRLLGRGPDSPEQDFETLQKLLGAQNSQNIRAAALINLRQRRGPKVADVLVSAWRGSSPAGREEIIGLLLGRPEWRRSLLDAIEAGTISAAAIGAAQRQQLLTRSEGAIREQANKLFTAANVDRESVVSKYQSTAALTGDPARGHGYFQQNCLPCHRLRNEGNEVGADLGSVATKPIDYLIVSILDPNRSVETRYMSYSAITRDEVEYTGIIVSETANSITLRQAGGKDVVLLRNDLKDFTGGSRSLMPDGFENSLNPQALADLIAYIRSP